MNGRTLIRAAVLATLGCLVLPAAAGAAATQSTYSWGSFDEGSSNSPAQPRPTLIGDAPADVTQMVVTNSATYELTANGQVWAFGDGTYGELGDGLRVDSLTTPVQVQFPAGVSIASLPTPGTGPQATMLAIDTNGNAWGWGYDEFGQLCLGSATLETTPVRLPFTNVTAVAGGARHASYLAGGTVYSCGDNLYGSLGDGSKRSSTTPVAVNLPDVVSLYAGSEDEGALTSSGDYYDWGNNELGQLGNGTTTNADKPQLVVRHVTEVYIGGDLPSDGQTLILTTSGKLKGWGSDGWGQLCNGVEEKAVTRPIVIHPPAPVASFTSGANTSYLLDTSGNLWACGANQQGQIGNGTEGDPVLTPTEVLSGVTQVSATSLNVAAVTG